ncbi:MAG: transposase [Lacunisphaera sp.]|nr:transposase [Lacunisphaera sp.]
MPRTIRFTHRHLPHWEVADGRYFVTVHCADSLPKEAVLRLKELTEALHLIAPRSGRFAALQREAFRTLEKYLDRGHGSCPLRLAPAATIVREEFATLSDWGVAVPHFTIMPNHWHVLLVPAPDCPHSLSAIMKRLKGRTAKCLRATLGGRGPVWQCEWFDRWMRSDAEWEKCVAYIRNNPVKGGLVQTWPEHPWTK